jgi:8-oxo-dGTP diphosphatase
MNTEYVAGFVFSDNGHNVVLIRKNKPDWQRGKRNGVGGKIEPGETPSQAMEREYNEEAGVLVDKMNWTLFCSIKFLSNGDTVHFFKLFSTDVFRASRAQTDESLELEWTDDLRDDVLPNLKWLIPLALSGDILHCTQL